jgi:hypothetical protein
MSSNVHAELSRNDWQLNLVHDLPSQSLRGDPSIDDPVNDTGLGPRCGDLQVSGEFENTKIFMTEEEIRLATLGRAESIGSERSIYKPW